jgi:hypothetical protein
MKKKTTITTEKHEVWIIHPHSGSRDQNTEIPVAELPLTAAVVPELDEDPESQLPTQPDQS